MKLLKSALLFCLAIVTLVFARPVSAQQIAYDEADYYVVTANWTNGANLGFGFTPWTILTNGPDFQGTYIQSANVPPFVIATVTNVLGTNYTDVWGTFANGTNGINITTAFRGFASPLERIRSSCNGARAARAAPLPAAAPYTAGADFHCAPAIPPTPPLISKRACNYISTSSMVTRPPRFIIGMATECSLCQERRSAI
jgi:hypothetical protein